MTSINNLNSALNSLSSNQSLRANEDGSNLHTVSGFEKIGLAFQKHVLRKSPEQLGTSQAIIGKAIANLYKNEHPGATTNEIGKVLSKLGFKEFAKLLTSAPSLSARGAALESAPKFTENKDEIYGSFTKSGSGRAGTAQAPVKKESLPEHLAPASDVEKAVAALNAKEVKNNSLPEHLAPASDVEKAVAALNAKEAKEPTPPPRKESLHAAGGNNSLPEHLAPAIDVEKAVAALNAKEAESPAPPPRKESLHAAGGNNSLPEHLAPASDVEKAVAALNAKEAESPTPPPRKESLNAAGGNNSLPEHLAPASDVDKALAALKEREAKSNGLPEHLAPGDEIAKAVDLLNSKSKNASASRLSSAASHGREIAQAKQATTNTTAKAAPSNDAKAQIADIQRRLQLAEEGKHVNEDGTRVRPFKAGEREKDVSELKAKLAKLETAPAGQSKISPEVANLIKGLKSGAVTEGNFLKELFPLIQNRLGDKASQIIDLRSDKYYHHLGTKARYTDIGTPKETNVSLRSGEKVHANYIPVGGLGNPAIATQAPKAETLKDFASLIQEQNVTTIIDLTNPHDKETRKIPDYARKSEHGFQSTDQTSPSLKGLGIEKRDLQVANSEHKAAYLNLTTWPDHGVVSLDTLSNLVDVIAEEHGDKPGGLCIHCTAGVGRTGTVFAGIELSRLAKGGELTADNFAEKVLDVVAEGRKARGNAFVQAPGQLDLLFDYAQSLVR